MKLVKDTDWIKKVILNQMYYVRCILIHPIAQFVIILQILCFVISLTVNDGCEISTYFCLLYL